MGFEGYTEVGLAALAVTIAKAVAAYINGQRKSDTPDQIRANLKKDSGRSAEE